MKGFTKEYADAVKYILKGSPAGLYISVRDLIDALIEPEPAPAPQFKPGDKVWCISSKKIVTVQMISGVEYRVSNGEATGWTFAANLRPLTDEERASLDKPQWTVGNWVYCTENDLGIAVIIPRSESPYKDSDLYPGAVCLRYPNGHVGAHLPRNLRPLCDADWTRVIGGVPVRAYEKQDGFRLCYPNGYTSYFSELDAQVVRAALEAQGLPFMPYSLSQGNFKHPEE